MARASIPLRLRLPNPPSSFVGRREEIARLSSAVRASPLTVLWGLGGAGKTALLLQTLHTRFRRAVPRTLFVAIRPGGGALATSVARALGEASGAQIDWPGLATDPEALAGVIVDLAEAGPGRGREPWVVVLDDLHHADAAEASALLGAAARYARRARVIATSRFDPGLSPGVGETIALGAMSEPDLAALAQRVRRLRPAEAREAARHAAGSPWRLLQHGRDDTGTGLSESLRAFLGTLSEVQVAIPRAALASIAPPPEPLDLLTRRGLLESSAGGLRVHDVVRGMLPSGSAPAETRARMGRALLRAGDGEAALEGLRLLLGAGGATDAASDLETRLEELLAAGYGPRLWALLAPHEEAALSLARLHCAVDLGTNEALSRVHEPDAGAPMAARLAWARARRLVGDMPGATAAAERVRADAQRVGDDALAFEAGILWARLRLVDGAPEEVVRELARLAIPDRTRAARRDALAARALGQAGRMEEALAAAERLSGIVDGLALEPAVEVGNGIARVFYEATRLAAADDVLVRLLDRLGPSAIFRTEGRSALHARAYIAQDRGDITGARALLKRLAPFTRGSGFLRASLRTVELILALAWGDLEALDESLAEWTAEAEREGSRSYAFLAAGMRVRFASLTGRRATPEMVPDGEVPDAVVRGMLSLWRIQNGVRHGADIPREQFPRPRDLAANKELAVLGRTVGAEWALLAGDSAGALADARIAVSWARDAGLGLAEADALPLLCDVLLLLGRDEEHESTTRAAEALADRLPSARLSAEAAFHRAILDGEPASLEPIAAADDPLSRLPGSRRARALLGAAASRADEHEDGLDAIDALVVDAVRARHRWAIETLPARTRGAPWGIDERRESVWLEDGRVVSFRTRRLPFRLLLALAARGGAATKEELVRDVWNEEEYHRLRHDNRLHLAILKARRAIEADPAKPVRLLATPTGYAFGGAVRHLRARGQ